MERAERAKREEAAQLEQKAQEEQDEVAAKPMPHQKQSLVFALD